jgi:hypothetical protein
MKPAKKTKRRQHTQVADPKYSEVAQAFAWRTDVSFGDGKGFGSGALKVKGKIFAMSSSKGKFVVKLPKTRIDELLTSSMGKRFEPRPGMVMQEWLVPADEGVDWIELAKEACDFVKRGAP